MYNKAAPSSQTKLLAITAKPTPPPTRERRNEEGVGLPPLIFIACLYLLHP